MTNSPSSRPRNLGPTGEFPEGKLRPDDKGALNMAIGIEKGQVIIDFGPAPVTWIACGPEQALEVARLLTAKANEILAGR